MNLWTLIAEEVSIWEASLAWPKPMRSFMRKVYREILKDRRRRG